MSASPTPPHAEATIARSSRRLGLKIPGVSRKINCVLPQIPLPLPVVRVVCAFGDTLRFDEAELEKIYELFMEQLLADEEENS